jgi:aconitate hydratase
VGRAKEVRAQEEKREAGSSFADMTDEIKAVADVVTKTFSDVNAENTGIGSTIFAVKPGDGSAREQAASCQRVLGGWANIANEYATKRYRSNLINWGMLPFIIEDGDLPFKNLDYLFVPGIKKAVIDKADSIKAYMVDTASGSMKEFTLTLGSLTDEERQIILKGCLINFNRR